MIEVPIPVLILFGMLVVLQFGWILLAEYEYRQMHSTANKALDGWQTALKGWKAAYDLYQNERLGAEWPDTIEKQ